MEKELARWPSKFPEHQADFEAYILNSIKRRSAAQTNTDSLESHSSVSRKSFNNSSIHQRAVTDNKLEYQINGVVLQNNDDEPDEFVKVINQVFPYQEGTIDIPC